MTVRVGDELLFVVDDVRKVSANLTSMSYAERIAQPCIGQERADFVLAGCAILEALLRILTLAADRMKSIGSYCQQTFDAFFFVAMDVALNTLGISKNRSICFSVNPES